MTATGTAPDVLTRARDLVSPAMADAVGRLDPEIRRVVSYHLGWTDPDGRRLAAGGGKGVRPAMALLSAEAAGSPAEKGVPGAVAIELVHNFSLIHDDVMDGDRERRHRATVWAVFGLGPAIVAGDALVTLAHQMLVGLPGPSAAAAARCLADATATMIAGQASDLAFETRAQVSVDECIAMSAAKTGALLACASSIGAELAAAPGPVVGALREFGSGLGLAFQAVDDLLGIWGDPHVTGKPAGNDLRQRKKTLPVVAALAAGGRDAEELQALLAGDLVDDDAVARAADLVEGCGGRQWTTALAKTHLEAALGALDRVELDTAAHHELAALADFILERDW